MRLGDSIFLVQGEFSSMPLLEGQDASLSVIFEGEAILLR
jgi:hypothetical protein